MSYYIDKICPVCHNNKIELSELGTEICTACRYVLPTTNLAIQDINEFYIQSDGVGTAWGRFDPDLIPYTLQIDADLIKLRHKEMELEFELEPDKLEKIDTIIVNGYKYVKEK